MDPERVELSKDSTCWHISLQGHEISVCCPNFDPDACTSSDETIFSFPLICIVMFITDLANQDEMDIREVPNRTIYGHWVYQNLTNSTFLP